MADLMLVSNQWATRPADERFRTVQAAYDAASRYAASAREKMVPWTDLRVEATDNDLRIVGKADVPARLTHHAFGQLAARAGAPASYLRNLPATLAAQNLNFGLKTRGDAAETAEANLLFHSNGDLVLRAATTERYERVWNHEVLARVLRAMDTYHLTEMRPTFDWTGAPVTVDREAAVYVSDHDMFVGLLSQDRELQVGNERLFRFALFGNSEVGKTSLWGMSGYLRDVCGNFILWGAQDVVSFRLTHRGTIRDRFGDALLTLRAWMDSSAREDEAAIRSAQVRLIGANKDEVLDTLFGLRAVGLPRRTLEAAYDAVLPDVDGDPNTTWGMVQGLTRVSQASGYMDERIELDRTAAKLMTLTF
jgi:hypothetical protein